MNGRASKRIRRVAADLDRKGHPPPKGRQWSKVLKRHWQDTPHNEKADFELLCKRLIA